MTIYMLIEADLTNVTFHLVRNLKAMCDICSSMEAIYETDMVCTYKMIDDEMESDDLWRVQFLQIFRAEGTYNERRISDGIDYVLRIVKSIDSGKRFLDKAWEIGLPHPMCVFITKDERSHANEAMLIQMYYSWATMDIMHRTVSKLIRHDPVDDEEWDMIIQTFCEEHKLGVVSE